jgi:hypothetical protein
MISKSNSMKCAQTRQELFMKKEHYSKEKIKQISLFLIKKEIFYEK